MNGYNKVKYNAAYYNAEAATGFSVFITSGMSLADAYTKAVTLVKAESVLLSDELNVTFRVEPVDQVLLEDGPLTFVVTKGPQDTIKMAEWVRLERIPPVIPWGN